MDLPFAEKVLKNWKKNPEGFTSHETSTHHRDCVKLLNHEETTNNIANEISDIHIKKATDKYFFRFYKIFSFLPVKVWLFGAIMEMGILIGY